MQKKQFFGPYHTPLFCSTAAANEVESGYRRGKYEDADAAALIAEQWPVPQRVAFLQSITILHKNIDTVQSSASFFRKISGIYFKFR